MNKKRREARRVAEARRAAEYCETISDASLEQRLRIALSSLAPPHRRVSWVPA